MKKLPIFISTKERVVTYSLLSIIGILHLLFLYKDYTEFISKPFFYTTADVIYSHTKTKSNRTYQVLKLRLKDGRVAYTSKQRKITFKTVQLSLNSIHKVEMD